MNSIHIFAAFLLGPALGIVIHQSVFPKLSWFILSLIGLSGIWAIQHFKKKTSPWLNSSVGILTLILVLLAVQVAYRKRAMLLVAERFQLPAAIPTEEELKSEEWTVRPYFYVLGAWPNRIAGLQPEPVFHQLPYAKGPPQLFYGSIIAKWKQPNIRLMIEGPKTPANAHDPALLKICLESSPWSKPLSKDLPRSISMSECWAIREAALERHLQHSASDSIDTRYQLKWFEIDNPALTDAEKPRGFYLSKRNDQASEDRFVWITPKGVHQALILIRSFYLEDGASPSAISEVRAELSDSSPSYRAFLKAVQSTRVFSSLDAGRTWNMRALSLIDLSQLEKVKDSKLFYAKIAEIQALLLSQMSVNPRGYDAVFHFGGLSHLTAVRSIAEKNIAISAIAKPNLFSAWRYAMDIAPNDPRSQRLGDLYQAISK